MKNSEHRLAINEKNLFANLYYVEMKELNLANDLETLNEKKLFQEEYDIEMYNWEIDYNHSKEFDSDYSTFVDYNTYLKYGCLSEIEDYEYELFLGGDDYENYFRKEFIEEVTEYGIYEEYYSKRMDELHSMKSNDPDEKLRNLSSLCGFYSAVVGLPYILETS